MHSTGLHPIDGSTMVIANTNVTGFHTAIKRIPEPFQNFATHKWNSDNSFRNGMVFRNEMGMKQLDGTK